MKKNSWLLHRPGVSGQFRLFCFCYAGGNAVSFMEWQSSLHPSITVCAVQLPGRGARYHEAPYTEFTQLIKALAHVIGPLDDLPCAFFGHSLGGLLAFELARYHIQHGLVVPLHLFVSGCHAPRYPSPSAGMHLLDDDSFIEELKQYKGTPVEVLEHSELMSLVLPTIRADFTLVENYQYIPGSVLNIPITVLAGKQDAFDSMNQVTGWEEETTGSFRVQWFDGDHFFIHGCQTEVLACLNSSVTQILESCALKCG